MEVREKSSTIERDLELNRGLCFDLLQRLNDALEYVDALSEDTVLPGWIERLFGGREGLVGAYIRLSQQQLRIAAVQVEIGRKAQTHQEDAPLCDEDIALVRVALKRWGEREENKIATDTD